MVIQPRLDVSHRHQFVFGRLQTKVRQDSLVVPRLSDLVLLHRPTDDTPLRLRVIDLLTRHRLASDQALWLAADSADTNP